LSRKRHRSEDESGIDLTPMLDVVFIMLIFFIVTTTFVRETGIEINRPTAQTAEARPGGNILVALRANGEIWIDQRVVDLRAVRANVERLRAENPEGTAVILADRGSETGLLVQVMDQIRLGGIQQIAIAATDGAAP
jgi:biopolymer transport protein ExbD